MVSDFNNIYPKNKKYSNLFKCKLCHGLLVLLSLNTVVSSSLDCCQVCDCQANEVWCEQRRLNSVPKRIPPNTKRLYLFSNNISSIPAGAFAGLESLEVLDLRSNKLTSDAVKPGVLNGLTSLQDLMLSENRLTTLKKGTFSGINNLVRLYLKDNRLNNIEEEALENLTHLVELKLSNNLLNEIPSFVNCPSLRRLCLNNNNLGHLNSEVFQSLNLEELSLSNNFVDDITPSLFGSLSNMRLLDLSKNRLIDAPRVIRNMTSLQHLNLSGNSISSIPEGYLERLKKLKVLDLKNLQLSSLASGFIPRRVYLNIFDISNNPWTCNCDIAWLIGYINQFDGMFISKEEIQCSLPRSLQGHQLATLTNNFNYCKRNISETTTTKIPIKPPQRRPARKPTVDVCDAIACANGGTCFINQTSNRPACRCLSGWKGFLCDEMISAPPSRATTSTTSLKSTDNPKLLIVQNSLTSNSVDIMFPNVGKPMTISTTLLTSNGLPEGLAKNIHILPTTAIYTVEGLEPGKKYNICITSTELLHTSSQTHTIKDKLCSIVTTKVLVKTDDRDEDLTEQHVDNANENINTKVNTDDGTTQTKSKENEQNSAVMNTSVPTNQYTILIGVGFGLVFILLLIGLIIYLKRRRSKHSNKNHNTEIPRQHGNHQAKDIHLNSIKRYDREVVYAQNAVPSSTKRYDLEVVHAQNMVPLLRTNGDCNGFAPRQTTVAMDLTPYNNTSQKLLPSNHSESLGRSSNSGGSISSHNPQCYSERCCSQSSSGHFSGPIEDIRNTTPPNAALYNASMTPRLDNRDHETVFRRHNSPSLSADTYAESSFREGPMGVVPTLATNPSQYHYRPAGANTLQAPNTNPSQLGNVAFAMNAYPQVVRPQPVTMHCAPTKHYRFVDPPTSQFNDDVQIANHIIDSRSFVKTLAV